MEANRSITRVFHCAHHPDDHYWYLSEFEHHPAGTGAADVAWHWCCRKGCEWQHEDRGNHAWVLRTASPPPSPPATLCFTRITSGSQPHVPSLISINSSWHSACLLLCPPPRLSRTCKGPVSLLGWAPSRVACPLASSCAYFSDTFQISTGEESAHIQKTRRGLSLWAKQNSHANEGLKGTEGGVAPHHFKHWLMNGGDYLPHGAPSCSLAKWDATKNLSCLSHTVALAAWVESHSLRIWAWSLWRRSRGQRHSGDPAADGRLPPGLRLELWWEPLSANCVFWEPLVCSQDMKIYIENVTDVHLPTPTQQPCFQLGRKIRYFEVG